MLFCKSKIVFGLLENGSKLLLFCLEMSTLTSSIRLPAWLWAGPQNCPSAGCLDHVISIGNSTAGPALARQHDTIFSQFWAVGTNGLGVGWEEGPPEMENEVVAEGVQQRGRWRRRN
jgi:hypothetical protein